MNRKPIFLVAAAAEAIRFLALAALASLLGAYRESSGLPALLRYFQAPQILFAAAFFFLWYDGERYAVYRPLALCGKALSLAFALPLALAARAAYLLPEAGVGGDPGLGLFVLSLVLAVDFAGIAVLVLAGRKSPGAGGSGRTGPGAGKPPDPDQGPRIGQSGPEDIERVEA